MRRATGQGYALRSAIGYHGGGNPDEQMETVTTILGRYGATACRMAACLAVLLPLASLPAHGCGFHGGGMAAMQRILLGWSYPQASQVSDAVAQARSGGMIEARHFPVPGDMTAFARTADSLQQLSASLGSQQGAGLPAFSLVLTGPMMWSAFAPGPDGIALQTHTARPSSDTAVVVSDVAVIGALNAGELSGEAAIAAGLLRFYGDSDSVSRLRAALVSAFASADRSGVAAVARSGRE